MQNAENVAWILLQYTLLTISQIESTWSLLMESQLSSFCTTTSQEPSKKKKVLTLPIFSSLPLLRFHLLTNYLECAEACFGLGRSIALTHDADIIHGDLTTSNFMLRSGSSHGVVCLAKASHVVPKLTGHR